MTALRQAAEQLVHANFVILFRVHNKNVNSQKLIFNKIIEKRVSLNQCDLKKDMFECAGFTMQFLKNSTEILFSFFEDHQTQSNNNCSQITYTVVITL